MTTDQILVQIRMDAKLKEEAAEVFEKMGIDIPTAVRMFFKAAVREQCLPFDTNVSNAPLTSESEKMMRYIKNMMIYEPPIVGDNDNDIAVLPLENGHDIPATMYVQLITKVPEGKVTCWDDIFSFLSTLYEKTIHSFLEKSLPRIDSNNQSIPYWRIVTNRGILMSYNGASREAQREQLMKEGIPIIQRGNIEGSYKVDNYKEYMFDFNTLNVIM